LEILALVMSVGETAKELARKRSWVRKGLYDLLDKLNELHAQYVDNQHDSFTIEAPLVECDDQGLRRVALIYTYPEGFWLELQEYNGWEWLGRREYEYEKADPQICRKILEQLESAMRGIHSKIKMMSELYEPVCGYLERILNILNHELEA